MSDQQITKTQAMIKLRGQIMERVEEFKPTATEFSFDDWSLFFGKKDDGSDDHDTLVMMFNFFENWLIDDICIVEINRAEKCVYLYVFHDGYMDIFSFDCTTQEDEVFGMIANSNMVGSLHFCVQQLDDDGEVSRFEIPTSSMLRNL